MATIRPSSGSYPLSVSAMLGRYLRQEPLWRLALAVVRFRLMWPRYFWPRYRDAVDGERHRPDGAVWKADWQHRRA